MLTFASEEGKHVSRLKISRTLLFILVLVLPAHTGAGLDAPFAIQSIQPTTNGGFAIAWSTPPGKTNQVRYADSLSEQWQDLAGGLIVAGANVYSLSFTDYPAAEVTQRFYRIRTTTRANLIMSLVLDRSGSMLGNGGASLLPSAVSTFIDYFDDAQDRAAMVSFSYAASTDVTMRQPFKTDIKNAVNAMPFEGWTCTERGLTNALAQNDAVIIPPGESVVKLIVLFTDGLPNTWYWPGFNCGPRNIAPGHDLYDPATGAHAASGCTVPGTIPSIDGQSSVNMFSDCATNGLYTEAQLRAERIAYLARTASNYIYVIGLDPNVFPECGRPSILNTMFLKNVANTPDSPTYNPSQPSGDCMIATNPAALQQVFQEIASKILSK